MTGSFQSFLPLTNTIHDQDSPEQINPLMRYYKETPVMPFNWKMTKLKKQEGKTIACFNLETISVNFPFCIKGSWDKPFIRVSHRDEEPIFVQRRSGYKRLIRVL